MHALSRYDDMQKEDWAGAVDLLLADLINLAGLAGIDIDVVFDGKGAGSETKTGRLKVVYSNSGQTADSVIERLVFQTEGQKDVAVCTGDYAQQKVIGRGCVRRLAPRELEDMMIRANDESRSDAGAKRNHLEDKLPESIRRQLEAMRRGR